jgi:hypothetical protein
VKEIHAERIKLNSKAYKIVSGEGMSVLMLDKEKSNMGKVRLFLLKLKLRLNPVLASFIKTDPITTHRFKPLVD